jgi:hypothetical protein
MPVNTQSAAPAEEPAAANDEPEVVPGTEKRFICAPLLKKPRTARLRPLLPRPLKIATANRSTKMAGQLKNFKKNPVLLWAHDHTIPAIGTATKIWVV